MTETSNGKTALAGYVQAFERVNGRTPTDEENREALALVEVVRKSNLDPFLVYYLANKKAQDALERVPIETRAVIAEAQKVPADSTNTKPCRLPANKIPRQTASAGTPAGSSQL